MQSLKHYADWWFKDLTVRRGGYVIAEPINAPLLIFTVSIILTLITYRGFWHVTFALIAYGSLVYWGILEIKTGKSRFRKLLGIMGLVAVAGALLMRLGLY
jgi:hypothetical protein